MNLRKYLAIGLLATILTVSIAYGIDRFVTSNHLIGTQPQPPRIDLTGNMTGVQTYQGDTFALKANLTGASDRLITFYCNGLTIGAVQSIGGIATLNYHADVTAWDIYAEASYT